MGIAPACRHDLDCKYNEVEGSAATGGEGARHGVRERRAEWVGVGGGDFFFASFFCMEDKRKKNAAFKILGEEKKTNTPAWRST